MQIKLVDLLLILLRHKKIFIINFLLFSFVSAGISLLLPFWYTSTARLLPPESQSSGFLGLASMAMDLPMEIPSLGGLTTGPADVYLAIMRSRNVRETIITRFDLQDYFETEFIEDALGQLDARTHLDKTEEGILVIQCTERTPELAQKLTKAYLRELDRVNIEVRKTSATYTREFIEKRMTEAEADMQAAAQRLVEFQEKYGAFDIETQVKAQVDMSAQIRAEVAMLEVKKDVLQRYLTEGHGDVQRARFELQETQKQLAKLQNGISPVENDLLLSVKEIPELGKEYLFIKRDIEVQKAIYQLLAQQYEQAKIQEKKDSPTIQILDAPTLPQKRSKPQRTLIVITSALASIVLSVIIVWGIEALAHLKNRDPKKYDELLSTVKNVYKIKRP